MRRPRKASRRATLRQLGNDARMFHLNSVKTTVARATTEYNIWSGMARASVIQGQRPERLSFQCTFSKLFIDDHGIQGSVEHLQNCEALQMLMSDPSQQASKLSLLPIHSSLSRHAVRYGTPTVCNVSRAWHRVSVAYRTARKTMRLSALPPL